MPSTATTCNCVTPQPTNHTHTTHNTPPTNTPPSHLLAMASPAELNHLHTYTPTHQPPTHNTPPTQHTTHHPHNTPTHHPPTHNTPTTNTPPSHQQTCNGVVDCRAIPLRLIQPHIIQPLQQRNISSGKQLTHCLTAGIPIPAVAAAAASKCIATIAAAICCCCCCLEGTELPQSLHMTGV